MALTSDYVTPAPANAIAAPGYMPSSGMQMPVGVQVNGSYTGGVGVSGAGNAAVAFIGLFIVIALWYHLT